MPFTWKDQAELNQMAVANWFNKYREFLSMFIIEGEDGLRSRMQAFVVQENWGTEELRALASQCMSEAEVQRVLRLDPDADIPNYDRIYMDLFEKLTSQAFLALQERGALEDLNMLEEIPPRAEAEYNKLIAEAQGTKKAQASSADLDTWTKAYQATPAEWLRKPAGGVVRMKFADGVREIPVAEFRKQLDKAIAAGRV